MSCKQIEQFGKFESRIFTREIKNIFLTGPLSSDKAQGQTAHVIVFKEKDSSLKIANGEKELVTKKVGFS